jgi:4-amino-4-deoxy-L-arabinose transferase-like glycosyltransferase
MMKRVSGERMAQLGSPETVVGKQRFHAEAMLFMFSLIMGIEALMLVWTWRTWLDPIVDFGREVYVPWRLCEGEILYRDIAYFNGPLSPYLNLVVFWVLGPSIDSVLVVNYLVHVAIAVSIGILASRITTLRCGLCCVVVYQMLFAFAQYVRIANYNYLAPYSHELTHSMLLSFLCLLSLERLVSTGRHRWAFSTGCLLGLVFLTKPEPFLALATACVVGFISARACHAWPAKRAGLVALTIVSASVLVGCGAVLSLHTGLSVEEAWQGVLGAWKHVFDKRISGLEFYGRSAGWDIPGVRLLTITFWLTFQTLGLRFAWRESLARDRSRRNTVDVALFVLMILVGVVLTIWCQISPAQILMMSYSTLPVWILIVILALLARFKRRWPDGCRVKACIALACSVFAFLMLAKIPLNARICHYGFALAMPGTLILIAATWWVGQQVAIRKGSVRGFYVWMSLFFLVFHGSYLRQMAGVIWARDTTIVVNSAPILRTTPEQAASVHWALAEIDIHVEEDQTLAVWPEGALLNFLARRPNSTPYVVLMPPELLMYSERVILDAYRHRPPDFILLIDRDTSEYGVGQFGRGYARDLWIWLWQEYQPVSGANGEPAESEEFGMILLKRRTMRGCDDGSGTVFDGFRQVRSDETEKRE